MNEEQRVIIDPFTQQPRIEMVKREIKVSGGGMRGDTGPAGPQGPAGSVSDVAYTTIDSLRICDWSFGAFDSSIWNLGTGGVAKMKYIRQGRKVQGWIKIAPASDATTPTGFFIIVHPDDMPIEPKVESAAAGYPMPGGFGAIYRADTNGSAPYNGYRHGLAPIVQDVGTGRSLMMFFKTSGENAIVAGADNLWSPVSNTPVPAADVKGASFFGFFQYEAATAA